jgi:hypothetical protein
MTVSKIAEKPFSPYLLSQLTKDFQRVLEKN